MDTSGSSGEVLVVEDGSTTRATPISSQEKIKANEEPKAIVYESCIRELFRRCQCCGEHINGSHVTYVEAQMRVSWDCREGHSGIWISFPEIRGMPEANPLGAASVPFTGSTITEVRMKLLTVLYHVT